MFAKFIPVHSVHGVFYFYIGLPGLRFDLEGKGGKFSPSKQRVRCAFALVRMNRKKIKKILLQLFIV